MAKRLVQVESVLPFKRLSSLFKPGGLTPSAAIILIDNNNRVCMVTKRKKIDWGGSTVFPGGLLSNDADGKFVNYLQKYYSKYIKKYNFTFDDLMFRINALRELFEETGILLYKKKQNIINDNTFIYPQKTKMYSFNNDLNISIEWRHKVLNDPFQFEQLYRNINCLPDILSMIPWCRLQTPWRKGRRWDSRFYLSLINNDHDDTLIDYSLINPLGKEIVSINWININNNIFNKNNNKFKYPPPTIMKLKELNIICNKENQLLNEYNNAYFMRNVTAIRPKLAVCTETKKIIILWNRDYLYNELDLEEVKCNDKYEENEENIHRIYIKGKDSMETVFAFNRLYEYNYTHSKL